MLPHISAAKNRDGEESVGTTDEIKELVDESKWLETEDELARCSAPFAGSEDAPSAGYSWRSARLDDRNNFHQRN